MIRTPSKPNSVLAAQRRQSLILASIDEIAATGLSSATLSKIAARAGLAAGAINFYFDTKESLMYQTLEFLASELKDNITQTMADAAKNSAPERLRRLIEANLDARVATPEKIAAWYYFGAEAYNSPDIRLVIDSAEQVQLAYIYAECEEVIELGGKTDEMDALAIATSIAALVDGIWDKIQHSGNTYTPREAEKTYMAFLGSVFPWSFELPRQALNADTVVSSTDELTIRQGDLSDLIQLSQIFYKCRLRNDPNYSIALARAYLQDTLEKGESIFFVAIDSKENIAGYIELYEKRCPRSQATAWQISELYAEPDYSLFRPETILLQEARNSGRQKGITRIETEVAFDDVEAQDLYRNNGYNRDTVYKKYELALHQDSQ